MKTPEEIHDETVREEGYREGRWEQRSRVLAYLLIGCVIFIILQLVGVCHVQLTNL